MDKLDSSAKPDSVAKLDTVTKLDSSVKQDSIAKGAADVGMQAKPVKRIMMKGKLLNQRMEYHCKKSMKIMGNHGNRSLICLLVKLVEQDLSDLVDIMGEANSGVSAADHSSLEKWYYEIPIIAEDLINSFISHVEACEEEPLLYAGSVVPTYSSLSQPDVNSQGRRESSFQGSNPKKELSGVKHLEIKAKIAELR